MKKYRCNFCLNEFLQEDKPGPVRCPKCGAIESVKIKEPKVKE